MNNKIFLVFLLTFLLVIPTVLAVKVDYSPNEKGIENMKANVHDTILFGLFKNGEQGTMELKSHNSPTEPIDICINEIDWKGDVTDCAVSMKYKTNFGQAHQEALGDVTFINMKNGEEINREWRYVYLTEEVRERDVCVRYENITNSTLKNATIYEECVEYKTETYTSEVWKPYNSYDIPKGKFMMGIEVQSKNNDYVDGIWEIQGKKISRHAEWQASLETDLISWFSLNETSGTTASDYLGNNSGTANTDAVFTTALNGVNPDVTNTSADFSAGVDFIDLTNDASLLLNDEYSISVWVNMSSFTCQGSIGDCQVISKPTTKNNHQNYDIQVESDGDILFRTYRSSGPVIITSNVSITTGTWNHIVAVNKFGSGGFQRLYLNGEIVASTSDTGTLTHNSGEERRALLGGRESGSGGSSGVVSSLNGLTDELAIASRIWTTDEITTFYNDGDGCTYQLCDLKVTLLSPEDNANLTTNTNDFIWNVSDPNSVGITNTTIFIYNSTDNSLVYNFTNSSGLEGNYTDSITLNDGNYNWTVYAYYNDSELYEADTRIFTIDTELPIVEAELNETVIYNEGDVVQMSYNITDDNLDECWYNYNGTNTSITCGTELTEDITTTTSDLTIIAYGNDTAGNENNYTLEMTLDDIPPTINITSPVSSYDYLYDNQSIDLNYSINDTNLDSCWYEYNGTNNTFNCSTNTTFNYIPNVNNLTVYANDTFGNENNETVEWDVIITETNRNYNNETIETETETFTIDLISDEIIEVIFVYNGNEYSTTTTGLGGNEIRYSSTFDIPTVTADTNISFYWNVQDTIEINTTESEVLVQDLIYDFDETYSLLNITIYDEGTGELVNSTTLEMLSDYYIGNGNVEETIFSSSIENGNYDIGTNLLTSLMSSNQFSYYADGYQNRQWNGNLALISGSITDLELYLLPFTEGNVQFFHVSDSLTFDDIPGAFIKAERVSGTEYVFADSIYTDDSGSGNLWLNPDLAHKITVEKEGCITKSTTIYPTGVSVQEIELDCGSEIEGPEYNSTEFEKKKGITVSFNPSTREINYNSNNTSEHIKEFSINYEDENCNITETEFRLIDMSDNSILQTISSTDSCGETLSINQNITGVSQVKLLVIIQKNGDLLRWNLIYDIIDIENLVYEGSSFWDILGRLEEIDDFGLDQKAKNLIAFIILFLTLGYLSMAGVIKSEGYALYLFILGYIFFFSYIGWFYLDLPITLSSLAAQETINKWALFLVTAIAISGVLISKSND